MGENWRLLKWHFSRILINGEVVEKLRVPVPLEFGFTIARIPGKPKSEIWVSDGRQVFRGEIVVSLL